MPRGKAHSEAVRAQVMAALLAGQGVPDLAIEYRLPERTIRTWRQEHLAEIRREKGERLDTLLFGYLETAIEALTKQAKFFSEQSYLRKQPADQAAVLHGVMADKAIRILEAADRANDFASSEDIGGEIVS